MYVIKHNGKLISKMKIESKYPYIGYEPEKVYANNNGESNAALRASKLEVAQALCDKFIKACEEKKITPPLLKIYDEDTGEDMNPEVVAKQFDGYWNRPTITKNTNKWGTPQQGYYGNYGYYGSNGIYTQSAKNFGFRSDPIYAFTQAWAESPWANSQVTATPKQDKIEVRGSTFLWILYKSGMDSFGSPIKNLPSEEQIGVLDSIKTRFYQIIEEEAEKDEQFSAATGDDDEWPNFGYGGLYE